VGRTADFDDFEKRFLSLPVFELRMFEPVSQSLLYRTYHVDLQSGNNVLQLCAAATLNRKICAANGGNSML